MFFIVSNTSWSLANNLHEWLCRLPYRVTIVTLDSKSSSICRNGGIARLLITSKIYVYHYLRESSVCHKG